MDAIQMAHRKITTFLFLIDPTMRKCITLAFVLAAGIAQAQLFNNPFGFYSFERTDLARNKVTRIFEYRVTADEEESYGAGYMPEDSLYSKRFLVHETGWIIETLENSVEYGEPEAIGTYYYVYAGPDGKVSRMEFEGYVSDSYRIVFSYTSQGVLESKNVVTIDPTEERFESKKGVITASKRYTVYPTYDEEGNFVKGQSVYSGRAEFTHDKNGRLTEYKRYSQNMADDTDEALILIVRNQYTPEGRLKLQEQWNVNEGEESLMIRTTYTYDAKFLLTQAQVENVLFGENYYLRYVYK